MTEKKKMWNGGKTNITTREAKIFRQMEDGYDLDDSEIEFREDLVKREKLMREEAKNQKIQSKYSLSNEMIWLTGVVSVNDVKFLISENKIVTSFSFPSSGCMVL